MENLQFLTSSRLICVARSDRNVTLEHFGNRIEFNTLNPDLTLAIIRQLKSSHSTSELIEKLSDYPASQIQSEMQRLLDFQLLISFDGNRGDVRNPVLTSLMKDHRALPALSKRISSAKIGIADFAQTGAALESALADFGFQNIKDFEVGKKSRTYDLVIVVATPWQQELVEKMNKTFKRTDQRWLLVVLDDVGATVGPTFNQTGGPCINCLKEGSTFGPWATTDLLDDGMAPRRGFANQPLALAPLPFVALEVMKLTTKAVRPQTTDGFYRLDMFNLRMDYQEVFPSPSCEVCDDQEVSHRPTQVELS